MSNLGKSLKDNLSDFTFMLQSMPRPSVLLNFSKRIIHRPLEQSQLKPITQFLSKYVVGKYGIEIGGPSRIFHPNNQLPIYPFITYLDNVNYSNVTKWSMDAKDNCLLGRRVGLFYELEATNLSTLKDGQYDYLLCSHMIEHTANPIKALMEFKRVVKPNGLLLLIVPHKEGTFDHKRPTTTLTHMANDYNHNIGEDDQSHVPEIIALNDPPVKKLNDDIVNNYRRRCLHQHVFSTESFLELIDYVELAILRVATCLPANIIVVAQNKKGSENFRFLNGKSEWKKYSPFKLDRAKD
ncbi:MAG: methyltransferase domain-containing protein [Candidatus Bathyarchaeia archaeon]|jgi:SAM-dependent methyltransferase